MLENAMLFSYPLAPGAFCDPMESDRGSKSIVLERFSSANDVGLPKPLHTLRKAL